ncbi:MAG: hypothetical protein R3338_13870, partial [Thermoanaerobaculia bacterium]|nr:hypothetical protein [Thermoanaerobaculia bacterium]
MAEELDEGSRDRALGSFSEPDVRSPVDLSGLASGWGIFAGLLFALSAVTFRPAEPAEAVSYEERARLAARTLASSPADRGALETITELSLDLGHPRRVELWREAAIASHRLAPRVDTPKLAFVRAGFMHWYELDDRDREAVLDVAAELLSEEEHFRALWQPVLQATRDPSFLAKHAPSTPRIQAQIRDVAALWNDLQTYRRLGRKVPVEWRIDEDAELLEESSTAMLTRTVQWRLPEPADHETLRLELEPLVPMPTPAIIDV